MSTERPYAPPPDSDEIDEEAELKELHDDEELDFNDNGRRSEWYDNDLEDDETEWEDDEFIDDDMEG